MNNKATLNAFKEEVSKMAVLAKPVNTTIELDPKKAESFFAVSKKNLFEKAMERAASHNKDKKLKEER